MGLREPVRGPGRRDEPASSVAQTSATVNATVNPDGEEVTKCDFEYALAEFYESHGKSYEASAPCSSPPGSGEFEVPVFASLTGLAANATYHFRIVATNATGTSDGSDETFPHPTVVTEAASALRPTSATLNATVNPNGPAVKSCTFEYGITASYGSSAPCSSLPGPGTTPVAVSAPVTGLTKTTTYHFRIAVTNAGNTSFYGSDKTFQTPTNDSYFYTNLVKLEEGVQAPIISYGHLVVHGKGASRPNAKSRPVATSKTLSAEARAKR